MKEHILFNLLMPNLFDTQFVIVGASAVISNIVYCDRIEKRSPVTSKPNSGHIFLNRLSTSFYSIHALLFKLKSFYLWNKGLETVFKI